LLVNERYRLIRPLRDLNVGYETEIFEVEDWEDLLTLKVLKVLNSRNADVVNGLKREASALIALSLHEKGVPRVEADGYLTVGLGNGNRQLHCLVMEKIEGCNLEEWWEENGAISQELAVKWLRQLIVILEQIHQQNLLHRDIKPSNIMLREDGQLVLIDFGLVGVGLFGASVVGTHGYTAPEQWDGHAVPQSDFFALGRTFVYLFTGEHPFNLPIDSRTNRLRWRDRAPEVEDWFANLIDKLMVREWQHRPRNTQVILAEISAGLTSPRYRIWQFLGTLFVASVVGTLLVMGARYLGILQAWELGTLDHLTRLRPVEKPDLRLLVIKVTEEDINRYRHPLPDAVLAQLLNKLESYQPQVIGLDIYRDRPVNYSDIPVEQNQVDFTTHLQQNPRLIPICKVSSESDSGIRPLPGIPVERLGFSNVLLDSGRTLRRHLLYQTPRKRSPCQTHYAFSLQLAFRYLEAKGILPKFTPEGDLQLGTTIFQDLEPRAGGYQGYDPGGQQVLLNYRTSLKIAQEVTLTDVLEGKIDPTWVKDRVVLIGVTATSVKDNFATPLGEMRGLFIQAQMVSQILSAVLDGRPLLRVWPQWGDALWIWGWSLVGGVLVWQVRVLPYRLLGLGTALGALYALSLVLLIQGAWLPLLPSAIAFLISGGSVATLRRLGWSFVPKLIDSGEPGRWLRFFPQL
jgi:CHASE2 domain-containing sensor protein